MSCIKYIFATLSLLITLSVFGQVKASYKRHYRNGYLITNKGDTLFGRIRNQHNFDYKIKFIADSDSLQRTQTIASTEIRSLKINKDLLDKVEVDGKAKMLQKVANGYYELYAYQYMKGETPEDYYILQLRNGNIKISDYNFDELIPLYVFDCPDLKKRIQDKDLTFTNIVDIFRLYNRWKDKQRMSL